MYSRLALILIVAEDSFELLILLPLLAGAENIDMCRHDYFTPSSCDAGGLNPAWILLHSSFSSHEGMATCTRPARHGT